MPPLLKQNMKLNVKISVMVESVYAIRETDLSFRMKLLICLEWFDRRLKYRDLTNATGNNLVDSESASKLWIPQVIFKSDMTTEQVKGFNPAGLMAVPRKGVGQPAELTELHEHLYYEGSENPLVYNYTEERTFKCDYNLSWYPFDNQFCVVKVMI